MRLNMKPCLLQWNIFHTSCNLFRITIVFRHSTEASTHIDTDKEHLKTQFELKKTLSLKVKNMSNLMTGRAHLF